MKNFDLTKFFHPFVLETIAKRYCKCNVIKFNNLNRKKALETLNYIICIMDYNLVEGQENWNSNLFEISKHRRC